MYGRYMELVGFSILRAGSPGECIIQPSFTRQNQQPAKPVPHCVSRGLIYYLASQNIGMLQRSRKNAGFLSLCTGLQCFQYVLIVCDGGP